MTLHIRTDSAGLEWEALTDEVMHLASGGRIASGESAEDVAKKAIELAEAAVGADHPCMATSLSNLALVYTVEACDCCSQGVIWDQEVLAQAEPLFKRALAIREKTLGPDDINVAKNLVDLARLYEIQGLVAQAEPLYKRALAIDEKVLGLDGVSYLNNLANLYLKEGPWEEVEPFYKRALAIRESVLGPDHLDVAQSLVDLASFYAYTWRDPRAEPLFKRALAITVKMLGPDHPDLAKSLVDLARFYVHQGRPAQAEMLYKRALAIEEKTLGPDHPDLAHILVILARFYTTPTVTISVPPAVSSSGTSSRTIRPPRSDPTPVERKVDQELVAKAEPLFRRALTITAKAHGLGHPGVAELLDDLAHLYMSQGLFTRAEALLRRSLEIRETALDPDDTDLSSSVRVGVSLKALADFYKKTGDHERAAEFSARYAEMLGDDPEEEEDEEEAEGS